MTRTHTAQIRRTTICVATAVAIALPSVASAGFLDRVKNRAQTMRNNATTAVTIIRDRKPVAAAIDKWKENRPIAAALGNVGENMPGAEIFDMVRQLQLKEQITTVIQLVQKMQGDYQRFAGGRFGCEGPCIIFREDLKAVFSEYVELTEQVPVLGQRTGIIENIDRLKELLDYVPARALYVMWQAFGSQLDDLKRTADQLYDGLDALQPLLGTEDMNRELCIWINRDEKLFIEMWSARFDAIVWLLDSVEGLVPDLEWSVQVGGEAGIAFANASAETGVSFKITDILKTGLKVLAMVPDGINKTVNTRLAWAKWECHSAGFGKDQLALN